MTMKARRILVQEKHNRICPHCGKNLLLMPPVRTLYPWLMGVSKNGVDFCIKPSIRLFSYTKQPNSDYTNAHSMKSFYETNCITRFFGNIEGSRRLTRGVITLPYIRERLERNKIYSKGLVFMCNSCKKLVAVNKNPQRFVDMITYSLIGLLWLSMICLGLYIGAVIEDLTWLLLFVGLIVTVILGYSAFIMLNTQRIEKYENNIAPLDGYGNLVHLTEQVIVSKQNLPHKHCHIGNIFSVEIEDKKYCVYITSIHKDNVGFHFCGDDPLFNFRNEKDYPMLPLYFNNALIATVKVIRVLNPPKQSPKTICTTQHISLKQNWCCECCGYMNTGLSLECISCGKYRK